MADRDRSAFLADDTGSARGHRGRTFALLGLPLLAVAGVLAVSLVIPGADTCGAPIPGCGNLRNAGQIPVDIQAAGGTADVGTVTVQPGQRVLLFGPATEVRVDAGQCLTVEGGLFWNARTDIDRVAEPTGLWHTIDDWGARVHLRDGPCLEQM